MKQQGKQGASYHGIIGIRWKNDIIILSLWLCVLFYEFISSFTKALCLFLICILLFSSAFFLFPLPHIAIAALLSLSTNSVFSLSSIYYTISSMPLVTKFSISPLIVVIFNVLLVSSVAPVIMLINSSILSVVLAFSVANKSSLCDIEMQARFFLPVYINYNHRTLYKITAEKTASAFHFLALLSKTIMACLDYPLCNTQTLSCKTKVTPIV